MATVTLQGNPVHTNGELPANGATAPAFVLTAKDMSELSVGDFAGKKKLLSIFPSVDTPTCALSTKKFNDHAKANPDVVMFMISADLPFAQARFCGDEGLENVHTLSSFRHPEFAQDYGVQLADGPLAGVLARAVLVLDGDNKVLHSELVGEIADEPDYNAALAALA